jgi:predicted transcriptional regulator
MQFRRIPDIEAVRSAGRAEGEVNATLRDHDSRLRSMGDSIAHLASEMASMVLEVQRLSDAMKADRETAVRSSEAVRAASEAAAKVAEETAEVKSRRRDFVVTCAIVVSTLVALASLLVSAHII